VLHNTAQNSSDYLPSHPQDNGCVVISVPNDWSSNIYSYDNSSFIYPLIPNLLRLSGFIANVGTVDEANATLYEQRKNGS